MPWLLAFMVVALLCRAANIRDPTLPNSSTAYAAMIGYGNDPSDISWLCGGSLISYRYVLSAAHCTLPSKTIGPANYVRMGDLNTESDVGQGNPQQFKIVERIDHPGYRPTELSNDIALYKLERNVNFNEYVLPACLYDQPTLPPGPVVATGWGRIEFAGPVSPILLKVSLSQYDGNECSRLVPASNQLPRGINTTSMICAGERDGSKDTCPGDSGGPLILQRVFQKSCLAVLVGVTSFGRQCGLVDSPGVYTRVTPYIPWIESVIWSKGFLSEIGSP